MNISVIIRFGIIGLLWVGICAYYIAHLMASSSPVTLLTLFPIVASGVIVFVPLYKKYIKNGEKADSNKPK